MPAASFLFLGMFFHVLTGGQADILLKSPVEGSNIVEAAPGCDGINEIVGLGEHLLGFAQTDMVQISLEGITGKLREQA